MKTLLSMLPEGQQYHFTGSGRLVKKDGSRFIRISPDQHQNDMSVQANQRFENSQKQAQKGVRISPSSIKYKAVRTTDDIPKVQVEMGSTSLQSHASSSHASNMDLNSNSNGNIRPPGSQSEFRTNIPGRPMVPSHAIQSAFQTSTGSLTNITQMPALGSGSYNANFPPLQDPTSSGGHQYLKQSNLVPRPPSSASNLPTASLSSSQLSQHRYCPGDASQPIEAMGQSSGM